VVVSPTNESDENCAPQSETEPNTNTPTKSESTPTKSESNVATPAMSGGDASSREGTPGSGYRRSSLVNMRKMRKMFQNAAEENFRSISAYATELKVLPKLQYQKQLLVCQVCTAKIHLSYEVDLEDYVSRPYKISAADVSTIFILFLFFCTFLYPACASWY